MCLDSRRTLEVMQDPSHLGIAGAVDEIHDIQGLLPKHKNLDCMDTGTSRKSPSLSEGEPRA